MNDYYGETPQPSEFPPSSRAYDQLVNPVIDEALLTSQQRQNLYGLPDLTPQQLEHLNTQLARQLLTDPGLAQTEPFYVPLVTPTGTQVRINPTAKGFVHRYQDSEYNNHQAHRNPASQTFISAEALTAGDSGTYALCAVAVDGTEPKAALFNTLARAICTATMQMDAQVLQQRIRSVFCNNQNSTPPPIEAAAIFVKFYNRTDIFPGYKYHDNLRQIPSTVNANIANWGNIWKTKAQAALYKLQTNQSLSLNDIKDIELISHLYKVEKVIPQIADQVPSSATDSTNKDDQPLIQIIPPTKHGVIYISGNPSAETEETEKPYTNPLREIQRRIREEVKNIQGHSSDASIKKRQLEEMAKALGEQFTSKEGQRILQETQAIRKRTGADNRKFYTTTIDITTLTRQTLPDLLKAIGTRPDTELVRREIKQPGKPSIYQQYSETAIPGVRIKIIYPQIRGPRDKVILEFTPEATANLFSDK